MRKLNEKSTVLSDYIYIFGFNLDQTFPTFFYVIFPSQNVMSLAKVFFLNKCDLFWIWMGRSSILSTRHDYLVKSGPPEMCLSQDGLFILP